MDWKRRKTDAVTEEEGPNDDACKFSSQWAQLPHFLSEMVLSRLIVSDQLRFSFVCGAWFEAQHLSRSIISPAPQLPWLMLYKDSVTTTDVPLFFSLSEKRSYHIRLPVESCNERLNRYVISSCGWLVLLDFYALPEKYECLLFNPLTGKKIPLPPYEGELNNSLVALSSPPTDPTCVVALARFDGFAICRPGDQEPHWRRCRRITCGIHDFLKRGICDVTFCNDRFYWLTEVYCLISLDCNTGDIDLLEMDSFHLRGWLGPQPSYTPIARLLEYQGEILRVLVCNLDRSVVDRPPMIQIKVYRADLRGKSAQCKLIPWVRVSSLGGKVAFISGKGRSILVNSASYFGAYRGDQICFAKPGSWKSLEQHQSPHYQWRWLIFDMKDGATTFYNDPVEPESDLWNCSSWMMPSL